MRIVLCVFLTLASVAFADDPRPKLSGQEVAALRVFGNRRGSPGALLNPPRGSVASEIRKTEAYLRDLMLELGGQRLKDGEYQYFISLTSSETPGVFVDAHLPSEQTERRFLYEEGSRNSAEFAQMMGFDPKKIIYEFSFSVGMLRKFKNSRAKLAAIVGHELFHLFEGHARDEAESQDRAWWSSQSREAVADQGGLELITGKYRLEAALEAVWELSSDAPTTYGLQSLASDHHHPGVRLAALQARIENIRRTNLEAARVTRDEPLPDFTQVSVSANVRRSPEFDEIKPTVFSLLDRTLLEDFWISREYTPEKMVIDGEPPQPLRETPRKVLPNGEQLREFTVEYVERLEKLNVSKEQHLQMIFRFLLWQVAHFNADPWTNLTHSDLDRLTYLIGKYSANVPQESLTQLINRAMAKNPKDINVFISRTIQAFFSAEKFQPKIARLLAMFPVWRALARDYVFAKLDDDASTIFALVLEGKVDSIYGLRLKTDPAFASAMRDVIKSITALPPSLLDKCPDFIRGLQAAKENANPEIYQHLKNLLDQQAQAYRERRLSDLRNPRATPSDSSRDPRLKALVSVGEIPMTAEELQLIRPYVLDLARGKISQHLLQGTFHFQTLGFFNLVSEMLLESISEEDKFSLIRLTTLFLSHGLGGKKLRQVISPEAARRFASYLRNLKSDKLLTLFAPHFPNLQEEILEILRKEAGFKGSYEDISNDQPWEPKVIAQVSARMRAMHRSEQTLLILLSHPALLTTEFLDQISADTYFKILSSLMRSNRRTLVNSMMVDGDIPSLESTEFLLKLFLKHQASYQSLDLWLRDLQWIRNRNSLALEQDDNYKKQLSRRLEELLQATSPEERGKFLSREMVHRLLPVDSAAKWMVDHLEYQVSRSAASPEAVFNRLVTDLNIYEKYRQIYQRVISLWSERRNIQPRQFRIYYPLDTRSMTEQADAYSTHIRGLSAMVAEIRKGSAQEQIQAIEYLMGLAKELPDYLKSVKVMVGKATFASISLALVMLEARERLAKEDILERTMVVNCILAGPGALGGTNRGKLTLLDYFTKGVRAQNKELARLFGKAIIRSQGVRASLGFAYVFASKSLADNTPGMSEEARILRALFTAFGVPGIKLGQYLGFTAEFQEYQIALRSLQDSATPLTYHAAIQLILGRFGKDWPKTHRVLRIIGSGSVNVAVEILNTETGENEVYSILREDIEASLEEDFRNLDNALSYVVADRKWGARLRFLTGLSRINRTSIRLELDKERVFLAQKAVYPRYDAQVDGWTVKTVRPYDYGHGSMRMEKAKGRTARKVLESNPEIYKRALRALNKVEMDLLLGRTQTSFFFPTHANPDFHDGQVLIDEQTNTVTILDFGQSVEITNAEREFGMDLLATVSNSQRTSTATRFVNGYLQNHGASGQFSEKEMSDILASRDRMDIFTKLIAEMELKGAAPPLATTHWVLAVNRAIELGKKIGANNAAVFAVLIGARKLGINPPTFNRGRAIWQSCAEHLRRLSPQASTIVH